MERRNAFGTATIHLAGTTEQVVIGGRDRFGLLPAAFEGVKMIGVIGWGSQGPAQAQNLRDSLDGTGIRVKVGLRSGSASFRSAGEAGFRVDNDSAGEMFEVASRTLCFCSLQMLRSRPP
jgi:ketol-acid reductoisomerase